MITLKEIEEAFKALGVEPDDALGDVEKKYRRLIREYHPDRVRGRGLSPDFVSAAEEASKRVNSAWDLIRSNWMEVQRRFVEIDFSAWTAGPLFGPESANRAEFTSSDVLIWSLDGPYAANGIFFANGMLCAWDGGRYIRGLRPETGEAVRLFDAGTTVSGPPAGEDDVVWWCTEAGYCLAVDLSAPALRTAFRIDGSFATGCAVMHRLIFAVDRDGVLRAMDAGSGAHVWTVNLGVPWSAPVAHEGLVCAQSEENEISCFSAETGEHQWTCRLREALYPPLMTFDGCVTAPTVAGGLHVLDIRSGRRRWSTEVHTDFTRPFVGMHAVYSVYEGTALRAYGLHSGLPLWTFETGEVLSCPVRGDQCVFVLGSSLYAVDAATGSPVQEYSVNMDYAEPVAAYNGIVFIVDLAGRLYATAAEPPQSRQT